VLCSEIGNGLLFLFCCILWVLKIALFFSEEEDSDSDSDSDRHGYL
jgi:hypothetical protein